MIQHNKWIDSKTALRIAQSYPKGPRSLSALIWAGKQGNFIRRAEDNFHYEFCEVYLREHCEISNKTKLTDLAKKLNTNTGSIQYIILKHNIKYKISPIGRKYLEKQDVQKIIRLYRGSHNGK